MLSCIFKTCATPRHMPERNSRTREPKRFASAMRVVAKILSNPNVQLNWQWVYSCSRPNSGLKISVFQLHESTCTGHCFEVSKQYLEELCHLCEVWIMQNQKLHGCDTTVRDETTKAVWDKQTQNSREQSCTTRSSGEGTAREHTGAHGSNRVIRSACLWG